MCPDYRGVLVSEVVCTVHCTDLYVGGMYTVVAWGHGQEKVCMHEHIAS